jgi:hypothetical protein
LAKEVFVHRGFSEGGFSLRICQLTKKVYMLSSISTI